MIYLPEVVWKTSMLFVRLSSADEQKNSYSSIGFQRMGNVHYERAERIMKVCEPVFNVGFAKPPEQITRKAVGLTQNHLNQKPSPDEGYIAALHMSNGKRFVFIDTIGFVEWCSL